MYPEQQPKIRTKNAISLGRIVFGKLNSNQFNFYFFTKQSQQEQEQQK
jgi:hypothetical protein